LRFYSFSENSMTVTGVGIIICVFGCAARARRSLVILISDTNSITSK